MSFCKRFTFLAALTSLLCFALSAEATVKVNNLFSNGMVLQRGVEVPVWGTAADGEKVSIEFLEQTVTTTAKNGRWMVHLKKLKAGGPFTMTIKGENTIVITDVLVGEVWLASGQSNMAFTLSRASNAESAQATAADPLLRFFAVAHLATDESQPNAEGVWKESTPQTATNFSAVAYFFGRDLRKTLNVPIGLIDSSVGGTPAEAWASRSTLEADPELKQMLINYADAVKKFKASPKKPANPKQKTDPDPSHSSKRPSGLFNAMIAPLQPYAIAGVIWYQGEANSPRAAQYQKLFPAMIRDWRTGWAQGDFPFLFVQIAPHERMTPEIREAQLLTSQKVPRTAMAVITDVGEEKDIHPKQKEPVGHRLALAARAIAYGEKIEYSGPIYKSMKVKGDRAVLSFTHTEGGLIAQGGELKGFTVAGPDGKFVTAKAAIEGNTVVVSSEAVPQPTAVRYGWAAFPEVNLFNKAGLPASPFRTDIN